MKDAGVASCNVEYCSGKEVGGVFHVSCMGFADSETANGGQGDVLAVRGT